MSEHICDSDYLRAVKFDGEWYFFCTACGRGARGFLGTFEPFADLDWPEPTATLALYTEAFRQAEHCFREDSTPPPVPPSRHPLVGSGG